MDDRYPSCGDSRETFREGFFVLALRMILEPVTACKSTEVHKRWGTYAGARVVIICECQRELLAPWGEKMLTNGCLQVWQMMLLDASLTFN